MKELMKELEAIRDINATLDALTDDQARRVINWVFDKYEFSRLDHIAANAEAYAKDISDNEHSHNEQNKYTLLKEGDLKESDSTGATAIEIAETKLPKNKKHMCAVATWYFTNHSTLKRISIDHIYTYFSHVGWTLPTNLANTLHQAGSDGLLLVSDKSNIRLTNAGKKLVESELRPQTSSSTN